MNFFNNNKNLSWNRAAETQQTVAVQVIWIISVPHTIVLDAANRVLINYVEFLNDKRIEEMVEKYFRSY